MIASSKMAVTGRRWASCAVAVLWLGGAAASASASGEFGPPGDLSAAGRSAYAAQVASDGNGDALAVWLRSDGANVRVQIAQRSADGAFGEPVHLSAPGRDATGPQVAMSAASDAVVTWCQSDGARARLYAAVRRAGREFTDPQPVSPPDLDVIDCDSPVWGVPQTTFGPFGEVVAVWSAAPRLADAPDTEETEPAPAQRVQVAELPATADAFSEPRSISPPDWYARNPQVAIDATGDVTVVWRGAQHLTYFRIQAVTRPAGGEFGPAQELSGRESHAEFQRIATNADGAAAVVWGRVRLWGRGAEIAVRDPGGGFGAAHELSRPNPVPDYRSPLHLAGPPAVAVDGRGNAIAVWRETEGAVKRVFAAVRLAGGGFGAPQPLSAPGRNAGAPRVAFDGAGNAIAVWRRRSDSFNKFQIQAALRPAGGSFGAPETLSSDGRNAFAPRLAVNPTGGATIVWRRSDGTHWRVQSTRYTPAPTAIDPAPVDGPAPQPKPDVTEASGSE